MISIYPRNKSNTMKGWLCFLRTQKRTPFTFLDEKCPLFFDRMLHLMYDQVLSRIIRTKFVAVLLQEMLLNAQKPSKIKGLIIDRLHCREPYNQFSKTLCIPSNPYFIRFSRFTLYHISSLFYIKFKNFGTKLVQDWHKRIRNQIGLIILSIILHFTLISLLYHAYWKGVLVFLCHSFLETKQRKSWQL